MYCYSTAVCLCTCHTPLVLAHYLAALTQYFHIRLFGMLSHARACTVTLWKLKLAVKAPRSKGVCNMGYIALVNHAQILPTAQSTDQGQAHDTMSVHLACAASFGAHDLWLPIRLPAVSALRH